MTTVYIGIGSNIQRKKNIHTGVHALRKNFGQLRLSSVYDTVAIGFDGPPFFNLIATFKTQLEVQQVCLILDQIEKNTGENTQAKNFRSRKLDLDIILFGNYISQDPKLNIPRNDIMEYAFILEALAEMAPNLSHPILKKTYLELWQNYDKKHVYQKRINFDF
ncbi:2-amino-4-hydroxy-6-hydroxymethyldihydropteridinepyrophosphokinase [uncultured Candidatus Thioglobus sp.]|nr:2-amino-4-hydroxy-6-hydroxymethyldihydropteridinepyrophosphokinase [uncultured Candidatus Thioglobus sp.]